MITTKRKLLAGIVIVGLSAGYLAAKSRGMEHIHTDYGGPSALWVSTVSPTPNSVSNSSPLATQSTASSAHLPTMETCTSPAATITQQLSARKLLEVRIPLHPKAEVPVYRMLKGEKATFSTVSAVDGKLAIHGITRDMAIRKDQTMQFDLQTDHAGRFPMHIHGQDGSHLEVAVIEISPQ